MSLLDLTSKPSGSVVPNQSITEILTERVTAWNEPLAYVLSAVVVFLVGFGMAVNL